MCIEEDLDSLSEFNVSVLAKICNLLGVKFNAEFFSKIDVQIGEVKNPGEWALRICETLGAKTYINPPGGESMFDKNEYRNKNINLVIQDFQNISYPVRGYEFVSDLSIIDVLMWNDPKDIKEYLDNN